MAVQPIDELGGGSVEIALRPVAAHPAQSLDDIGQEDLVGHEQILRREVAFVHLHARSEGEVDDLRPQDAGGRTGVDARCVQHPVGNEEKVGGCALDDAHPVILDEGGVEPMGPGPDAALHVEVGGDVLEPREVVRCALHFGIDVCGPSLVVENIAFRVHGRGHHDHIQRAVLWRVEPVSTARQGEAHASTTRDALGVEQGADVLFDARRCEAERSVDAVGLEPFPDALVVIVQKQRLAMGNADGLEDAVRKEESPIPDGNPRGFREKVTVVENVGQDAAKLTPPTQRQGGPLSEGRIGFDEDAMSNAGPEGTLDVTGLVSEHPAGVGIQLVLRQGLLDHERPRLAAQAGPVVRVVGAVEDVVEGGAHRLTGGLKDGVDLADFAMPVASLGDAALIGDDKYLYLLLIRKSCCLWRARNPGEICYIGHIACIH